jgi:dipeptidyl aminopeptidase/acylaminoacyl peptidase
VDVMNLMALLEKQGGQPGPLQQADASQMHLLGHSMGGGIALRILTVYPGVEAAVLYGSMSGDEVKNYEQIQIWSNGENGAQELATAPEDMQRIAPMYFYQDIEAAVGIHHGELDGTVPPQWSTDLCQELQALQKQVECFMYPDQPHTFQDEGDRLFMQRVIDFFARH